MLRPLHDRIRREDIDNAEIVYRVHRLVRIVRRAQPAVVLVEQEVLPLARVFVGEDVEDVGAGGERLRVDAPDGGDFGGERAFAFAFGGFAADEGDFGLRHQRFT